MDTTFNPKTDTPGALRAAITSLSGEFERAQMMLAKLADIREQIAEEERRLEITRSTHAQVEAELNSKRALIDMAVDFKKKIQNA